MSKTTTRRPSAAAMRSALKKAGLPVPVGDPKALIAAFNAIPTTPKPAAARATRAPKATPAAKPAPANCGCGCGAPTITAKARFLAGHDARHAGNLGRALGTAPIGPEREALTAQVNALSPALKDKVLKIATTASRKQAVKDARATAKAAYAKALADALA